MSGRRKGGVFRDRGQERSGLVWASLGAPPHDVPPFPEVGDPAFRLFHAGPYPFGANAFRSVENFIDPTHFPFVHSGFNGVMAAPDPINDYEVFTGPDGLRTSAVRVFQPYGDHRALPGTPDYHYPVLRPPPAYFQKFFRIVCPEKAH